MIAMDLIYTIPLLFLLLEVSNSMRNFHIPHGYLHNLAMHDNYEHNYQYYDSFGSEGMMLRSHRKKYQRNRAKYDTSGSEENYKYECKCSCAMCKKPKQCCQNFCMTQCATHNNILVVPYPVPFIVQPFNRSTTAATMTEAPTTEASSTEAPTTEAPTAEAPTTKAATTATPAPPSRKTLADTQSTLPIFVRTKPDPHSFKRFRIIQDKRQRRDMGSNAVRPRSFEGLPKYGIVPIPNNLALKLMKQMRNDHKNGRRNLNTNILHYAD